MKLAGFFTRKIGPLPAWAWAGVAALAVVLARHFLGGKTTPAAGGDLGAAAGAGNAQTGYGAFGSGGGDAGGLPTDQGTADPALGGPGTATVFDPTGGPTGGQGGAPLQLVPYDSPTGVAPPVVHPKQTTSGNTQHTGGATRAGHGPKRPPPGPEIISEHGQGQTRPKHTRGQRAKNGRVAGTGRAPNLVSEHGKGQATVTAARRVTQSASPVAVAPARAPAASHPDAGARPTASSAGPVGTTTSTKAYERMGRKLELD